MTNNFKTPVNHDFIQCGQVNFSPVKNHGRRHGGKYREQYIVRVKKQTVAASFSLQRQHTL